jgi:hypothetical protein
MQVFLLRKHYPQIYYLVNLNFFLPSGVNYYFYLRLIKLPNLVPNIPYSVGSQDSLRQYQIFIKYYRKSISYLPKKITYIASVFTQLLQLQLTFFNSLYYVQSV